MGNFIFIILIFCLGIWIGRKTAPKKTEEQSKQKKQYSFSERQHQKVLYASDVERIRELNTLSATESMFLRQLKQAFLQHEIVIKKKRFFIVDKDRFPVAIFEYRDGKQIFKTFDIEDGLPVFLYKGLISNDGIREDAKQIESMSKR